MSSITVTGAGGGGGGNISTAYFRDSTGTADINYYGGGGGVDVTDINNLVETEGLEKLKEEIKALQEWALPVNMIVQCDYCGTFAVRGFSCTQCGAPINLNKRDKTYEKNN